MKLIYAVIKELLSRNAILEGFSDFLGVLNTISAAFFAASTAILHRINAVSRANFCRPARPCQRATCARGTSLRRVNSPFSKRQ